MGITRVAGTSYLSEAREFTPVFSEFRISFSFFSFCIVLCSLLFVLFSFLAIKMYVLRFVFLITPLMSSNLFFLRYTTYHFQHHLEKASVISGGLKINVNYFESIWQETIMYSLIWKESLSSHGNHFHQFLYISSTEIIML